MQAHARLQEEWYLPTKLQCPDWEGTYWHITWKLPFIIKVCRYNTGKSTEQGRFPIMINDAIKLITTLTLDVIKSHYFDNHFDNLVGGKRHWIFFLSVYIAVFSLWNTLCGFILKMWVYLLLLHSVMCTFMSFCIICGASILFIYHIVEVRSIK